MENERKIIFESESPVLEWEENARIKIIQRGKELLEIVANKAGMRSLAKQLMAFADMEQEYSHHYQVWCNGYYGDLEEGSIELAVTRKENIEL